MNVLASDKSWCLSGFAKYVSIYQYRKLGACIMSRAHIIDIIYCLSPLRRNRRTTLTNDNTLRHIQVDCARCAYNNFRDEKHLPKSNFNQERRSRNTIGEKSIGK